MVTLLRRLIRRVGQEIPRAHLLEVTSKFETSTRCCCFASVPPDGQRTRPGAVSHHSGLAACHSVHETMSAAGIGVLPDDVADFADAKHLSVAGTLHGQSAGRAVSAADEAHGAERYANRVRRVRAVVADHVAS